MHSIKKISSKIVFFQTREFAWKFALYVLHTYLNIIHYLIYWSRSTPSHRFILYFSSRGVRINFQSSIWHVFLIKCMISRYKIEWNFYQIGQKLSPSIVNKTIFKFNHLSFHSSCMYQFFITVNFKGEIKKEKRRTNDD